MVAGRRGILELGLLGAVGMSLAACAPEHGISPKGQGRQTPAPSTLSSGTAPAPRVLLAYFSRAGENYDNGGRTWLELGNTAVLARMIADLISCDVYEIEAEDPYPAQYDACVSRNVREQDGDTRPAIDAPLPDIGDHDVVILGSPIWNVRTPMIMSTFTERLNLAGKTVHPVVTHAMSGLGTSERDYAKSCAGATIGEGLAIRGEEVATAADQVSEWLRRIGLLT